MLSPSLDELFGFKRKLAILLFSMLEFSSSCMWFKEVVSPSLDNEVEEDVKGAGSVELFKDVSLLEILLLNL